MKNYYDKNYDEKKRKIQQNHEQKVGGFKCSHCKQWVIINDYMGTANRNHCNICLWSKHVDQKKGDRRAMCHGGMKPIGLTFKHEGYQKQGEIMLIHLCTLCCKISINRIAGDDMPEDIIAIFEQSFTLESAIRNRLVEEDIYLLLIRNRKQIMIQLFGK